MMVHGTGGDADGDSGDGDSGGGGDWLVIWQSELAALAVDREWQERMQAWGQAWLAAGDTATGRAGPDAAAGPPAPGAAPGVVHYERELRRLLATIGTRLPP